MRSFRNLVDANQQLRAWLLETAGNRIHGSTHEKPLTLFETERHLLKPLPDKPPELAVWEKVTVHGNLPRTVFKMLLLRTVSVG